MLKRYALIAATAIALLGGTACDDDGDNTAANPGTDPSSVPVRAGDSQQGTERLEEVTIDNNGTSPRQLNITANVAAQLRVTNRSSSACNFFLGNYVQGIQVPAGQTVTQSLTLPAGRNTEAVRMGCEGDTNRQGEATIEFKGVLPGTGGAGGAGR